MRLDLWGWGSRQGQARYVHWHLMKAPGQEMSQGEGGGNRYNSNRAEEEGTEKAQPEKHNRSQRSHGEGGWQDSNGEVLASTNSGRGQGEGQVWRPKGEWEVTMDMVT